MCICGVMEIDYLCIVKFKKRTAMKKIYYFTMMMLGLMAIGTLTGCEDEDDYIAQKLRDGSWEGYVGAYYSDRWGLSGTEYSTVMRFTSRSSYYTSGRGEELDYDTRSPYSDYAYCTFKWFIVDGEITLIYDDDRWSPIYIVDYSLGSSWFRGYIYDGSSRRIKFDFENSDYSDWGTYSGRSGSYGGFSSQNYFRSRAETKSVADGDNIPVIDRTDEVRRLSGEPTAVSILSGAFATAFHDRQ